MPPRRANDRRRGQPQVSEVNVSEIIDCNTCGQAFERRAKRCSKRCFSCRFWAKVNKDGPTARLELGPCWVWVGRVWNHGYGSIDEHGQRILAHRASWEIANGPLPKWSGRIETVVRHRCDNPICVRPGHLEVGTALDNMADCKNRGRKSRGERHPHSKLTEADVKEIRRACATKTASRREIARRFGVGPTIITHIANRQKWTHVA